MKKITNSKLKKLLIMLPVFLIGIAGLLFSIVNFTKGKPATSQPGEKIKNAFNKQLPAPSLSGTTKNKLEVYLKAARDSMKQKADWERDINIRKLYDPLTPANGRSKFPSGKREASALMTATMDPNEQKVNDRLKKLYAAMNAPQRSAMPDTGQPGFGNLPKGISMGKGAETERLRRLLQAVRTPDTAHDPTLDRVEKVLDKVLEIQHPEQQKRIPTGTTAENKPTSYPVSVSEKIDSARSGSDLTERQNGFYGLDSPDEKPNIPINSTIQAVVPETQTLQTGSTIKLRLLQDIYINGQRIPANSFIYGICTVNSERLQVQLNNAVAGGNIVPISLRLFDIDGLEGVFVPGAITRDLTKEGISEGISSAGITSFDPSLGAQAAAAGIETAKNLFSKKIKAVVVTVKEGHRVFLKNSHPDHS